MTNKSLFSTFERNFFMIKIVAYAALNSIYCLPDEIDFQKHVSKFEKGREKDETCSLCRLKYFFLSVKEDVLDESEFHLLKFILQPQS